MYQARVHFSAFFLACLQVWMTVSSSDSNYMYHGFGVKLFTYQGHAKNGSQAGHTTGTARKGKQRVQIPAIFCPKEGQRHETHNQSEGSEYLCGNSPLQDERYSDAEKHTKTRLLDDKSHLNDAYFMVPIVPHDRPLLRFQWQGKFICFPFGLLSAPWVFIKITRPLVVTLRSIGLRMIIYDMLIMAHSGERAHWYWKSGVHYKPPQINSDTNTGDTLSGISRR